MERMFPGSYRPVPEDVDKMWQEATVAFDANALLHGYRYRPSSRDNLLDAMGRVGDRLWLPHQAAVEFHRNRVSAINAQEGAFTPILEGFAAAEKALSKHREHPSIDVDQLLKIAQRAQAEAKRIIDAARADRIRVVDDQFLVRLTAIVGDRVGEEPDEPTLDALIDRGRRRYERRIPPGYEDDGKQGGNKYGDYLIWRELLDHGAANRRPIILVTDDGKSDWWIEQDGKAIGPRPELISEMQRIAGVAFHLSRTVDFVRYAQQHLGTPQDEAAIEEIEQVGRNADARPTPFYVRRERIPGVPSGAAAPFEGVAGGVVTVYEPVGATLDRLFAAQADWASGIAPQAMASDAASQAGATMESMARLAGPDAVSAAAELGTYSVASDLARADKQAAIVSGVGDLTRATAEGAVDWGRLAASRPDQAALGMPAIDHATIAASRSDQTVLGQDVIEQAALAEGGMARAVAAGTGADLAQAAAMAHGRNLAQEAAMASLTPPIDGSLLGARVPWEDDEDDDGEGEAEGVDGGGDDPDR